MIQFFMITTDLKIDAKRYQNFRIILERKILKITKLQLGKINFPLLSRKEEELADLINEKRIEFIR